MREIIDSLFASSSHHELYVGVIEAVEGIVREFPGDAWKRKMLGVQAVYDDVVRAENLFQGGLRDGEVVGRSRPARPAAGAVRIIACIEDPVVIEKILTHLDAKAPRREALVRPPSRVPPGACHAVIPREPIRPPILLYCE